MPRTRDLAFFVTTTTTDGHDRLLPLLHMCAQSNYCKAVETVNTRLCIVQNSSKVDFFCRKTNFEEQKGQWYIAENNGASQILSPSQSH